MYCKPFTGVTETEWVRLPGGEACMEIVSDIYRWQTLVTYTHRDSWDGFQPEACSASLKGLRFISLWRLTAQRKGMVIYMEISTSLNIYNNFVESYEEAIKRAYDCGFLCFDFNPIDYLIMRQRGTAILRFRQAITIFPVSAMAEASRNWRSYMRFL